LAVKGPKILKRDPIHLVGSINMIIMKFETSAIYLSIWRERSSIFIFNLNL